MFNNRIYFCTGGGKESSNDKTSKTETNNNKQAKSAQK